MNVNADTKFDAFCLFLILYFHFLNKFGISNECVIYTKIILYMYNYCCLIFSNFQLENPHLVSLSRIVDMIIDYLNIIYAYNMMHYTLSLTDRTPLLVNGHIATIEINLLQCYRHCGHYCWMITYHFPLIYLEIS